MGRHSTAVQPLSRKRKLKINKSKKTEVGGSNLKHIPRSPPPSPKTESVEDSESSLESSSESSSSSDEELVIPIPKEKFGKEAKKLPVAPFPGGPGGHWPP